MTKWFWPLLTAVLAVLLIVQPASAVLPVTRSATVVFATYDASDIEKAQADIVLDGLHDGSTLNAKLVQYASAPSVKFQINGHFVRLDVSFLINRGGVAVEGYAPGGRDPSPETGTIFWPLDSLPSIIVDGGPVPGTISNIHLSKFGTKAGTGGIWFKGGVVDSYVSQVKIEDAYLASIKLLGNWTGVGAAPGWIYIDRSNLTGGMEAALYIDRGVGEVQLQQSGLYSSGGPAILNKGGSLIATNNFMEYTQNHIVRHEQGMTIIIGAVMSPGNVPTGVYDAVNVAGGGYVTVANSDIFGANLLRWGVNVEPGATATVAASNNIYRTFLNGAENIPVANRN